MKLLYLALLLSSTVVFNTGSTIDETVFEALKSLKELE